MTIDSIRSGRFGFGPWALLFVLLLVTVPQSLRAQLPDSLKGPPATVGGLVAQMRAGTTQWISEFLGQVRGPRSPAELQAFGDSLVAFFEMPEPPESSLHMYALLELRSAITSERGTAFVQGVDLLYRIYDTVEDPRTRATVLDLLASASPPGRLLPVLTTALASEDIRALRSTILLAEEMGPTGIRILQDAYCAESIAFFPARSYLRRYFAHGILDRDCNQGKR